MAQQWSYHEDDSYSLGPSRWVVEYPDAEGCRQSPVDIQTTKTLYSSRLCEPPLQVDYHKEKGLTLRNNGYTVIADCAQPSTLTYGPLSDKVYKLTQFHFHWGSEDHKGSEHRIDGQAYSAEIHFVHWNTTDYSSLEEASDKSDGLAVLAVLVKIDNKHEGFELINKQLGKVLYKGDSSHLTTAFDPSWLLPDEGNRTRFWTYPGSLTTPPCFESVQFIVFEEPVQMSKEQMARLRSLQSGDKHSPGERLGDNFRPPCDLGVRSVFSSFKI